MNEQTARKSDPMECDDQIGLNQQTSSNAEKRPAQDDNEDSEGSSKVTRTGPFDTTTKRIRVDADDKEKIIEDQRRGRVDMDKLQRDKVLRYLLACHLRIMSLFLNGRGDASFRNVHISQQVTSIFTTIHSCLRQESLSFGLPRGTMVDKEYILKSGGIEIGRMTHDDLKKHVLAIANSFGLAYRRPAYNDTNHWYETASPLICFMNMFKVRMNELRLGHGSMVVRKNDGTTYDVSLSQYGFQNVHHPLLEGVTIPPEKRSGMAQSVGPLISLVCLSRSDSDPKYSRKWRAAVKRDLAFIPEIDSVIEACCGKPSTEVRVLFNIIADIILITTSREPKRASFPACMMYLILSESEIQHYKAYDGIFTDPTDISWFNFSGIGAAYLYNLASQQEFSCPIQDGSADCLPEILFHTIWGTFGTDFGILEFMTDYANWKNRATMGSWFNQFGSSAPATFRLIGINKFSKPSSADQTGLPTLSSSPMIGRSVFSGKHIQIFTDEFIEYLEGNKNTSSGITTNIEVLKNTLMQVKEGLINDVKVSRMQTRRTTRWHMMAGCSKTEYGAETSEKPSTKNKLYMQTDK